MTDSSVRHLLDAVVRTLKRRGVDYADIRYEHALHESLVAEQGRVASISLSESAGIGIRVLIKGSWGFASTPHLKPANIERAVSLAIGLAKAASIVNRAERPLAPLAPVKARHRSRCQIEIGRAHV